METFLHSKKPKPTAMRLKGDQLFNDTLESANFDILKFSCKQ